MANGILNLKLNKYVQEEQYLSGVIATLSNYNLNEMHQSDAFILIKEKFQEIQEVNTNVREFLEWHNGAWHIVLNLQAPKTNDYTYRVGITESKAKETIQEYFKKKDYSEVLLKELIYKVMFEEEIIKQDLVIWNELFGGSFLKFFKLFYKENNEKVVLPSFIKYFVEEIGPFAFDELVATLIHEMNVGTTKNYLLSTWASGNENYLTLLFLAYLGKVEYEDDFEIPLFILEQGALDENLLDYLIDEKFATEVNELNIKGMSPKIFNYKAKLNGQEFKLKKMDFKPSSESDVTIISYEVEK